MNLPLSLTFYTADYALDGGSTTLYGTDEHGSEHLVYLPRRFSSATGRRTIGLLHFDAEQIPVRSDMEQNVLRLLRQALISPCEVPRPGEMKLTAPFAVAGEDLEQLVRGTPEANLRHLVDSVIAYVESDPYASAGRPPSIQVG